MEIRTHEHLIRVQIIEIVGRLDAFSVQSLRDEQAKLLDAGAINFIIDLSQTTFMDSAGMSALVSLLKQVRQNGGEMIMVKPKEAAAYRILTLTRFDQVFTMAASTEEAISKF